MKYFTKINSISIPILSFIIVVCLVHTSCSTQEEEENMNAHVQTATSIQESSVHSSITYRALIDDGPISISATVTDLGGGAVDVTTSSVASLPTDHFSFYSPDLAIDNDGTVHIPDDGNTYWLVYFDSEIEPFIQEVGPVSADCGCYMMPAAEGDCLFQIKTGVGPPGIDCLGSCIEDHGVPWWCKPAYNPRSLLPRGSAILLMANTLSYNGVAYH